MTQARTKKKLVYFGRIDFSLFVASSHMPGICCGPPAPPPPPPCCLPAAMISIFIHNKKKERRRKKEKEKHNHCVRMPSEIQSEFYWKIPSTNNSCDAIIELLWINWRTTRSQSQMPATEASMHSPVLASMPILVLFFYFLKIILVRINHNIIINKITQS